MKNRTLFLLISLTFSNLLLSAQPADPAKLTIDRIFTNWEFVGDRFGQVRWFDDGLGYTTTERSTETTGGTDLVYYDAETGDSEIMIPASRLIPEGETAPIQISNYEWSNEKDKLLIFTNTKRVWRYNTRGDYWVLNLGTLELKQLGGDLPESSLMFAKFSDDGAKVAYVSKHNIYVENLENSVITQLTFDGSETTINGTFDWVYEEEFSLRDGFRWSPDGSKIAYWQLDATGIGEYLMLNTTDSIYSRTIPVQYPKVGTTNSACKVGVVSANGSETTWMKVPGDPRNNYIMRMDWAANSDQILIQHMNRLQNHLTLFYGDSESGEVEKLYEEKDEAWIDAHDYLTWLENGDEFLWVGEKDGWRHIYLISRKGEEKLLTIGDYDVIEIEEVDEEDGWIYFIASPENATQKYLYRISMDGNGTLEKLSPQNQPGTHVYQIAPGADFAIHTYSQLETPSIKQIISLPDHKVVRSIFDNSSLKEKFEALDRTPAEFIKVDIGEVELDGWMIKPPNFDDSKKYPVLFYVYGEPASQTVLDQWNWYSHFWHLLIAQQGYVVISVDNRGTPAPRGREWRKSIYKKIGVINASDQAKAAEKLIEMYDFIDADRLAVWGWSGGGSMSLNL
ncbi:MAG: S9 family peptidase, partial [Melioribacteraceae bacterium]|nr:S9 family peptidase [Melioribacteraceae bacterium]